MLKMNAKNNADLLEPVKSIAQQAGQAIMDIYRDGFTVEEKTDYSPVTEADIAADKIIVDQLTALTPEWPVLSEEGESIAFEERRQWQRYWLVDPLDGTREFIRRNGEFTVNIALIENNISVFGIIYVPVSGVCYYATAGGGAFKEEPGAIAEAINSRPWDGRKITIAGSRSHLSEIFHELLKNFQDHHVIRLGSSLKSCYVAEGAADLYARLGPTSEWDTAAAQCIVEEAGGKMTDTFLKPLRYNTKESLLNPHFLVFGDEGHDWECYVPQS